MPGHDANRLNCNTPFHAQKTIKKNNAEHFRWQAAYQAGDQAVANAKLPAWGARQDRGNPGSRL